MSPFDRTDSLTPLPIDPHLPAILDRLRESRSIVVVAEPGAGKTTRLPPAIIRAGLLKPPNDKLVMLQPRRIAARAAAARIADEHRLTLGREVGYHVRFDRKLDDSTTLRVLTEGLFTRQIVADPFLDGIGCVVLDEFHERSLDVDLALSMLREVRAAGRDDLFIVVMSATLDADSVARFLDDAPIVSVPGRTFPVSIEHRTLSSKRLHERIADEIEQLAPTLDGDVLVFLPGIAEISRAAGELERVADRFNLDVRTLHGSLSFDDQQRALRPSDRSRIVLATNIAETSLTIDGVTVVIDSGLSRVPRFDPKRGLDRLELGRISLASATQRAGRAGRTKPGRCIRLWTAAEQAALDEFELPEVRRVDLAQTLLSLRAWGVSDAKRFGWFDRPNDVSLDAAESLLVMLGAIDAKSKSLTTTGEQLALLPVHPRVGRLLLEGVRLGVAEAACAMAAVLSEKDFVRDDAPPHLRSPRTIGRSDLLVRIQLLDDHSPGHDPGIDSIALRNARRVRDELHRLVRRIEVKHRHDIDADSALLRLALVAYPDRVCARRANDPAAGVMTGGGGVRLAGESVVRAGDFFVALDARSDQRSRSREAQVRIASGIEPEWLEELFPQSIRVEERLRFDENAKKVVAERVTSYLDLPLRTARSSPTDLDAAGRVLFEAIRSRAADLFAADDNAARLLDRLAFVRSAAPELDWPNTDAESLEAILEEACARKTSVNQVDFESAIRSRLHFPLDRKLEEFAPESVEVPTGSRIRLDYSNRSKPPVLAVRLQELFGLADTPRVAGGRVKVVLQLLGPNYRPVQVTDDLASFWRNTYEQVRKDLRARYPKHSWPDDPLVATAIRGPRRRQS